MSPKVGEHLVEVVALVEVADDEDLHYHPDREGGGEGDQDPEEERVRGEGHRRAHERSRHVERAVREVHAVHDPEDEGQARGEQEEQHPELKPVQELGEDQGEVHRIRGSEGVQGPAGAMFTPWCEDRHQRSGSPRFGLA